MTTQTLTRAWGARKTERLRRIRELSYPRPLLVLQAPPSVPGLRNPLIRRRQRSQLLSGMWAALVTLLAGAFAGAAVVSGATALIASQAKGIDASAWFAGAGLSCSLLTAIASGGTTTVALGGCSAGP